MENGINLGWWARLSHAKEWLPRGMEERPYAVAPQSCGELLEVCCHPAVILELRLSDSKELAPLLTKGCTWRPVCNAYNNPVSGPTSNAYHKN